MHLRGVGLFTIAAAVALAVIGSPATTTNFVSYWDPAWSPDGKHIAFVDSGSVPGELDVVNADGSDRRQLTHSTPHPSEDRLARWRDDSKIVFVYGSGGLVVLNSDGSGPHRITRSGVSPDWSPRGRKIAFADGGELNGLSIFVVNPDGSRGTLVASHPDNFHSNGSPTRSPDGERIAFSVGPAPDSDPVSTYLGVVSSYRGQSRASCAAFAPVTRTGRRTERSFCSSISGPLQTRRSRCSSSARARSRALGPAGIRAGRPMGNRSLSSAGPRSA